MVPFPSADGLADDIAAMNARVLSAGLVIVRFEADAPRYLLLRAYRYWDFPKGIVEPGEDPVDAARREAWEEAGLTELRFRWGHGYRETPPYRGGKIARYYLAEAPVGDPSLPVDPALGRPEHHEFRWSPYTDARSLLVPRVQAILDWAHERIAPSAGPSRGGRTTNGHE